MQDEASRLLDLQSSQLKHYQSELKLFLQNNYRTIPTKYFMEIEKIVQPQMFNVMDSREIKLIKNVGKDFTNFETKELGVLLDQYYLVQAQINDIIKKTVSRRHMAGF